MFRNAQTGAVNSLSLRVRLVLSWAPTSANYWPLAVTPTLPAAPFPGLVLPRVAHRSEESPAVVATLFRIHPKLIEYRLALFRGQSQGCLVSFRVGIPFVRRYLFSLAFCSAARA